MKPHLAGIVEWHVWPHLKVIGQSADGYQSPTSLLNQPYASHMAALSKFKHQPIGIN